MKYSVCIEMLFAEVEFTERIMKTKEAGLSAVEFWCWWNYDLEKIARICKENEIQIVGICTRFIPLTDKAQADNYIDGLRETIAAAQKLNCSSIVSQIGSDTKESRKVQRENIIVTLKKCVPYLEEAGITLLLELVNREEISDYYETSSDIVGEILREVNSTSVKMLFDVYHQQKSEGNIITHLRRNIDLIGNIHAAGIPERSELNHSEIDYKRIFRELKVLDYDGYIGLEYIPTETVFEGIKRLPDL